MCAWDSYKPLYSSVFCCHNKIPETGYFIEEDYFKVLEAQGPRSDGFICFGDSLMVDGIQIVGTTCKKRLHDETESHGDSGLLFLKQLILRRS